MQVPAKALASMACSMFAPEGRIEQPQSIAESAQTLMGITALSVDPLHLNPRRRVTYSALSKRGPGFSLNLVMIPGFYHKQICVHLILARIPLQKL